METKAVKRTLSKISAIRKQYQFTCWFDANVDIEKEVGEARNQCRVVSPWDVRCTLGDWSAVVTGTIYDEECNKKVVECVRSHLLMHGWTRGEE